MFWYLKYIKVFHHSIIHYIDKLDFDSQWEYKIHQSTCIPLAVQPNKKKILDEMIGYDTLPDYHITGLDKNGRIYLCFFSISKYKYLLG